MPSPTLNLRVAYFGQYRRVRIAKALTDQGVEPPRGGAWSNKTVLRMMARLGLKTAA
jgi:hypothetical protein